MKHLHLSLLTLLGGLMGLAALAGCDTDISGEAFENQPPETALSVRDTSLVDNLAGADRLSSTVLVSWTGTDPDGYVQSYELRFFVNDEIQGLEDGWTATTRTDTLVLLPIPPGDRISNVAFEVRAIDNTGLKDPTPARTVFPIENSPPTISLSPFDLPPDTTFGVFSFAWTAADPEGEANLSRIEVSFNDSLNFVSLPVDASFASFVADDLGRGVASGETTTTEVFLGRGFQRSGIEVPGLVMDAPNTFYLRAVDLTDTTSVFRTFEWYVKKSDGDVLFVNDFRKASNVTVAGFHLNLLHDFLPADRRVDVWDVSMPFVTGNAGNAPRSDQLPPNAAPTLERYFAHYQYIYWLSTASTNSVQGNNLPFAAGVMDRFFEEGGKLMVHTPITLPADPEANLGNPAITTLPLIDISPFPDSLRRLSLGIGAPVTPVNDAPGTSAPLPTLSAKTFVIGALPFVAESANIIKLYEATYTYRTLNNRQGPWPGPSTVASLSNDRRVGLFVLPLVNEQTGEFLFEGSDGAPDASVEAIRLMLESLGFPKR